MGLEGWILEATVPLPTQQKLDDVAKGSFIGQILMQVLNYLCIFVHMFRHLH
jgi:hypothetical protein